MVDSGLYFGREVIKLLKDAEIKLDIGLSNLIILKVAEAYEIGREQGIKNLKYTLKKLGINTY